MDFKEKYGPWALVTGASSGIGRELALQLADKKMNLVLVSRRKKKLHSLAARLEIKNTRFKIIATDLKQQDFLSEIIDQTKGLDIGLLVHMAGEMYLGKYLSAAPVSELGAIRLNVLATSILVGHYANEFKTRDHAGIMLAGSMLGHIGTPMMATYSASKAFTNTYAESLYHELRKDRIDVIGVVPGLTRTPMTSGYDFSSLPMNMSVPADVARDAIKNLGRKPLTTYGAMNKVMNWMSKHIMSRTINSRMFGHFLKPVVEKTNKQLL